MANRIAFDFFQLDLLTILMACLLVSHGQAGAGIFAFGQGLVMDCFSAGLVGLFTFLFMVAFVGMSIGARFFDPNTPRGMIILVTSVVVAKGLLLMLLMDAFSFHTDYSPSALLSIALSAICSGFLSPFVFQTFNLFHRLFAVKKEKT